MPLPSLFPPFLLSSPLGNSSMTSERQIAANRRNASLSTGPRTAVGKAVVAQNALRHGLLAKQILIPGESETDLVDFGKRMRTRLAPVDELEMLLVDRI